MAPAWFFQRGERVLSTAQTKGMSNPSSREYPSGPAGLRRRRRLAVQPLVEEVAPLLGGEFAPLGGVAEQGGCIGVQARRPSLALILQPFEEHQHLVGRPDVLSVEEVAQHIAKGVQKGRPTLVARCEQQGVERVRAVPTQLRAAVGRLHSNRSKEGVIARPQAKPSGTTATRRRVP